MDIEQSEHDLDCRFVYYVASLLVNLLKYSKVLLFLRVLLCVCCVVLES